MKLLDGKLVSTKIKNEIKDKIKKLDKKPCLAVIKVGDDQASAVYVNNKIKACEYVGIESMSINFEKSVTQDKLLEMINSLNLNENVNGILIQLPLPNHIDKDVLISAIDVKKDVDCFHPYNVGKLYSGKPLFKPCTPWGIINILQYYNIDLSGKNCVIIGRSDIVGKPMAQLLLCEDSTVTICHSKTKNLKDILLKADIVISAIGKTKFIKENMISKNCIIVDVGINRDENNKLCGDVDFENVSKKCSYITPVPGGVGPLTISMLLKNTLIAYNLQNNKL